MNRGRVTTTRVAVLIGLTALTLWGVTVFIPLLLLSLTVALLHYGPNQVPATPTSALEPQKPHPSSVVALPSGPSELPLTQWSDAELCRAWQITYVQLQRRPGAAWTGHLAEQRRTYLEELQRRNPTGFIAWIDNGARAASDPTRYLTTPPTPRNHRAGAG